VVDGSTVPTSLGVNPQMTIMGNRSTYSGVTSDSGVSPLRTRMMLP